MCTVLWSFWGVSVRGSVSGAQWMPRHTGTECPLPRRRNKINGCEIMGTCKVWILCRQCFFKGVCKATVFLICCIGMYFPCVLSAVVLAVLECIPHCMFHSVYCKTIYSVTVCEAQEEAVSRVMDHRTSVWRFMLLLFANTTQNVSHQNHVRPIQHHCRFFVETDRLATNVVCGEGGFEWFEGGVGRKTH